MMINETESTNFIEIHGTPFEYDGRLKEQIDELSRRVDDMRKVGTLTSDSLRHIRKYFRIKNIYHSNAIEGNLLDVGETRQVVEQGLTISGKPLKDQAEATNLGHALDFLEQLASKADIPITMNDVRQIHTLILKDIDDTNAGNFREIEVKISGSKFSTPPPNEVGLKMREVVDWLESASSDTTEDVIQIAAALHASFEQIHPFVDGNGRTGRILMNLVLMRAGYPIAIITRDDRARYIDALEESQTSDLTPFIALLLECVSETLEEYVTAAEEKREDTEWAVSLASRFDEPLKIKVRNEYELWRSAMELLVGHYREIVDQLNDNSDLTRIFIKEFNILEFEKYLALRGRQSAKRTWFFRLDFVRDDISARYLHFFGYANHPMSEHCKVSILLSREESPFYFERLDNISRSNVPNLREIGYSTANEQFVARRGQMCVEQKIKVTVHNFFEEVVAKHFQN